MTFQFHKPPTQPGNAECGDCYGLGWALLNGVVNRCVPCDVYESDALAADAAAEMLAQMYLPLAPGEQLISGHGFEPFILHSLQEPTTSCTECGGKFFAVEAGYDRYGTVSLEEEVLIVEDDDFSEDGCGPFYLFCSECRRTYAPPEGTVDHR